MAMTPENGVSNDEYDDLFLVSAVVERRWHYRMLGKLM
jgi:hypothetical protein